MSQVSGILYVVATPMGNLADISQRALEVLARVALIAAEDTRHTAGLLSHYGLRTPLTACHEHNEEKLVPRLLERLAAGEDLALVSDAGTPLISDPGYPLVAAARAAGLRVVPIPGPNAAICALSAAGLPSDRFVFLGFPPRTRAKRREWFVTLAQEPGTLIFYEAGNRVLATLADLAASLGPDRRAVVARELTKHFETFLDGTLAGLVPRIAGGPGSAKGRIRPAGGGLPGPGCDRVGRRAGAAHPGPGTAPQTSRRPCRRDQRRQEEPAIHPGAGLADLIHPRWASSHSPCSGPWRWGSTSWPAKVSSSTSMKRLAWGERNLPRRRTMP